jgi:hypothetical protein
MRHRSFGQKLLPAVLAPVLLLGLLAPASGVGQEPQKKGAFIDGEYVEDYVYVPDFMPPEELKKLIDEHSQDIVIVDTAAAPIGKTNTFLVR